MRKMHLFLVCLIFFILFNGFKSEACKLSGVKCLDPLSYQACVNINGHDMVTGQIIKCPDGNICNDDASFPCVPGTPPPTTTTPMPITAPPCSGAGKYPATSCEQYYECVAVWWWWEPRLKDCPDGLTFDPSTKECFNSGLVNCKPTTIVTTTTTTAAPVTEPTCSGPGKYPAAWCEQYYECVSSWWWWELKLNNCPAGLTFDPTTSECINSGLVNCQPTTTSTTTTTVPPPVTPPVCSGAGKYPATARNQYYECKFAWFKWRRYLVTCPEGMIFVKESLMCADPNQKLPI